MFGAYGVLWKSLGGTVNFPNMPMVLGFTRKIYMLMKVPYNCILGLYFAMHYLNNWMID